MKAGDTTPSPTQKEKKKQGSVSGGGPSAGAKKDLDEAEDSDNGERVVGRERKRRREAGTYYSETTPQATPMFY